jgi:small subunit ribosomal protein S6e
MANFKVVVADPRTRKAQSVEVKDPQAQALVGLKIGEEVDASLFGMQGKIRLTGGSDKAGFPMRNDVSGGVKKYVLLTRGVGFQKEAYAGKKKRKLIRGNTVTEEIYQLNAVLI